MSAMDLQHQQGCSCRNDVTANLWTKNSGGENLEETLNQEIWCVISFQPSPKEWRFFFVCVKSWSFLMSAGWYGLGFEGIPDSRHHPNGNPNGNIMVFSVKIGGTLFHKAKKGPGEGVRIFRPSLFTVHIDGFAVKYGEITVSPWF